MNYRAVLFFVLMLLAFDTFYSLSWTCQPIHHSAAQHGGEQNNCSPFAGLFFEFVFFPLAEWLKAYEHELIAGFTIVLAGSTIALWLSTKKLWEAGEKQLAATQRPWVKVDLVVPQGPLIFENGEGRIDLAIVVSNKGNSPGLRVRANVKLVAANQISLMEEQKTFAAALRRDPAPNELVPEVTSWPGDTIEFPVTAWLSSVDMPRFKPLADSVPFPISLLAIVGCINYEFSFAPGRHQTGLIYTLRRSHPYPGIAINEETPALNGAIRLEGSVFQGDLRIAIGPEGTGPVD